MKDFTALLKKHNLKVTPQRLKIVTMLHTHGHINIEDLFSEIREEFPNVSLATIYKNIHQMTESGLVREVKIPSLKSVYEVAKEPHLHMVCDKCHKVEDIVLGTDKIIEEAEKVSGYKIEESFITLRGICPECRAE